MRTIRIFGLLAFYFRYFTPVSASCRRVVGGNLTTIERYPTTTAILLLGRQRPIHICGGTILNERHILTAAHCFALTSIPKIIPSRYQIRVGSSLAHSGGTTHNTNRVILHPKWNLRTVDCDVAIMRTASNIAYGRTVQPAYIAGSTYWLPDNASVWAVGWGVTAENGAVSEQLRHVQVFSINSDICRRRYESNIRITDNMLCSGWLDVGGRDQCTRDSGSPLYHNNVVVGISSMGLGCARPCYPGVNTKVSRFTNWIQSTTKPEKLLRHKQKLSPIKIYFDFDL